MGGKNHAETFGAGKATGYTADPEDLKLITDPKHYLYQERVKLPVDPFIMESMVEFGWIGGAVEVVVNGEEREISKGRQRIKAARAAKNFAESDRIRDELAAKGIVLKDSKDGTTWEVAR